MDFPRQHPLVLRSLEARVCALCGHSGHSVAEHIKAKTLLSTCPLCNSSLSVEEPEPADSARLQEIDTELRQLKKMIRDCQRTLESLSTIESGARQQWHSTKSGLDKFDLDNSATLDALRLQLVQGQSDSSLTLYRQQLSVLEAEKDDAYRQREKLKGELQVLQQSLQRSYLLVEQIFVPAFRELAEHFLGMPLSVQFETRATEDLKLIVSVRGTTRREQQSLSESQKFFLDIALRMALTQHMSDPQARGGMFIDTPEGSLDIAYEKRAGDMLAMFAEKGHQIIMTANLNSSRLLLELAHDCGPHGLMQLCRITDWAELTTVQREEEGLFELAYAQIESAMKA